MHLLLTDILTCPRCGPAHGLIVLADRTEGRRVLEGVLGCANCREKYAIRRGVIHATDDVDAPVSSIADDEQAVRLAALMGVTEGPANVLLAGPAAAHAAGVAALVEHLEVIAVGAGPAPPGQRVTPIRVAGALPLANERLAGVVLSGAAADTLLEEGVRVLSPLGRLVLEPAPGDATERLQDAGLRVLLQQDGTVVAGRF